MLSLNLWCSQKGERLVLCLSVARVLDLGLESASPRFCCRRGLRMGVGEMGSGDVYFAAVRELFHRDLSPSAYTAPSASSRCKRLCAPLRHRHGLTPLCPCFSTVYGSFGQEELEDLWHKVSESLGMWLSPPPSSARPLRSCRERWCFVTLAPGCHGRLVPAAAHCVLAAPVSIPRSCT